MKDDLRRGGLWVFTAAVLLWLLLAALCLGYNYLGGG